RAGVVDDAVHRLGITHDDIDAARRLRDGLEGGVHLTVESRAQQQVLRRIAGDGELGEQNEVGPLPVAGAGGKVHDSLRVAGDVADVEVDLGERDTHRGAQGSGHGGRGASGTPGGSPRPGTRDLYYFFSSSAIAWPRRAGDRTVFTPAASRAANLSAAVPFPPAMMAPAWPMRLPGGAVTPAM